VPIIKEVMDDTTSRPLLGARFAEAMLFAHEHHRCQLRKGGEIPYLAHPLAVASLVLELGGDEDEAIGALLHDVVEDGGGREALDEIVAHFGARVGAIVAANSEWVGGARPAWRVRKERYLAGIPAKDHSALLVSLADKLHNARAILRDHAELGEGVYDRFRKGSSADLRWFYRSLAAAFEARADALGRCAAPALRELRETVDELDRLAAAAAPPIAPPRRRRRRPADVSMQVAA
jgi:(p)ppGpp synthase/HD superfamily hydrolase